MLYPTIVGGIVGGVDFPKIELYDSDDLIYNTFVFNDCDMDSGENIKLSLTKEFTEYILATGDMKHYLKGYRLYCEIPFHSLKQLDSEFDQFLVDMHNASKIIVYPHKDHDNKFVVIIDNGWEYNYWLNKPYLGWEGTIKLKGVERLDRVPFIAKFPEGTE